MTRKRNTKGEKKMGKVSERRRIRKECGGKENQRLKQGKEKKREKEGKKARGKNKVRKRKEKRKYRRKSGEIRI